MASDRPFHDPEELRENWAEVWGAWDEFGPLREVLTRRPGQEFEQIRADAWREEVGGLVDPHGGWFWNGRQPPDRKKLLEQHANLVKVLEEEGVRVHVADPLDGKFTKSIYVRDPLISLPGGVVIGRLAAQMRRGEEADLSALAGRLGIPILRTVAGHGTAEGGSVIKLGHGLAAFGLSMRCNDEGARQLAEIVRLYGINLVRVDIPAGWIHLDEFVGLVSPELAVVRSEYLPEDFLQLLRDLGFDLLDCPPEERFGTNFLAVRPSRVIMSASCPLTAAMLEGQGIETISIPFDEIEKNGGGIHCSTQELRREAA